jgi:hypothetical protein
MSRINKMRIGRDKRQMIRVGAVKKMSKEQLNEIKSLKEMRKEQLRGLELLSKLFRSEVYHGIESCTEVIDYNDPHQFST